MYERELIDIRSASGIYSVDFKKFNYENLLLSKTDLILVDQGFAEIYGVFPSLNAIQIQAGEEMKDISVVARILSELAAKGANRETNLIAVGGGTIQDLSTFVASTYMRGIKWDFYPTTLQAMADSCIGGKSAINVGNYKNLVGNYHPPRNVYIDAALVKTLSREDITCGLLEALKICFAAGGQNFELTFEIVMESEINGNISGDTFEHIIATSLISKKVFIEEDEFDRSVRKKLNFGHTYGHAIEAATNFQIHHGLAVGIGMLTSFIHREQRGLSASEEKLTLVTRKLLQPHKDSLSRTIGSMDKEDFFRFLLLDKKITTNGLKFIHSIDGHLEIVSLTSDKNTLETAYNSVLEATYAI